MYWTRTLSLSRLHNYPHARLRARSLTQNVHPGRYSAAGTRLEGPSWAATRTHHASGSSPRPPRDAEAVQGRAPAHHDSSPAAAVALSAAAAAAAAPLLLLVSAAAVAAAAAAAAAAAGRRVVEELVPLVAVEPPVPEAPTARRAAASAAKVALRPRPLVARGRNCDERPSPRAVPRVESQSRALHHRRTLDPVRRVWARVSRIA